MLDNANLCRCTRPSNVLTGATDTGERSRKHHISLDTEIFR
jgi:hypothetical protein